MDVLDGWLDRLRDGSRTEELLIDTELGARDYDQADLDKITKGTLSFRRQPGRRVEGAELSCRYEPPRHLMFVAVALGDTEKNQLIAKLVAAANAGVGYGSCPAVTVMATPDTVRDAWINGLAVSLLLGDRAPVQVAIDHDGEKSVEYRSIDQLSMEFNETVGFR